MLLGAMQDLVFAEVLALPPGPVSLVELRSGAGAFVLRLVEAREDLRAVGLEPVTDHMRLATRSAIEGGFADRVRFERSDLLALPLSDCSTDYLLGLSVLAQVSSPHVLLSETFRALKLGGVAIFTEDVPEEGDSRGRPEGLALPLQGGALTESRLRALVTRSPFKSSVSYERQDFEGGTFLEIRLTRPIPDATTSGPGWRLGGGRGR